MIIILLIGLVGFIINIYFIIDHIVIILHTGFDKEDFIYLTFYGLGIIISYILINYSLGNENMVLGS